MSSITEGMDRQYGDSDRLAARARLHSFSQAEVPWFNWAARLVDVPSGGRTLDVGCGPAWFWANASQDLPRDLELTLLDQSAGMVREAVERCRPLGFSNLAGVVGDAVALPFDDASFNAVIAMHMLYHVADQERALAEFRRVLKPGGSLMVTANGRGNMAELYRLTTVFGSAPIDPSTQAFDLDRAHALVARDFDDVVLHRHPASMRATNPEVVYLALTSYPPGDTAPAAQQHAFRQAIGDAFAANGGAMDVSHDVGAVVGRKS